MSDASTDRVLKTQIESGLHVIYGERTNLTGNKQIKDCQFGVSPVNYSDSDSDSKITADIESEIRLFADDCVCFREIKDKEDTLKLQRDIDRLGNWARKWGIRFHLSNAT